MVAWMEASNFLSDWKSFVVALMRKFDTMHYTLPRGRLSKLLQMGIVEDYMFKFEEMNTKVLGLPDY